MKSSKKNKGYFLIAAKLIAPEETQVKGLPSDSKVITLLNTNFTLLTWKTSKKYGIHLLTFWLRRLWNFILKQN